MKKIYKPDVLNKRNDLLPAGNEPDGDAAESI